MKRDFFLTETTTAPKAKPTSKYQVGDMDMLERYDEKPMPAIFEQIDRTYKTMHNLLGLPLPTV